MTKGERWLRDQINRIVEKDRATCCDVAKVAKEWYEANLKECKKMGKCKK